MMTNDIPKDWIGEEVEIAEIPYIENDNHKGFRESYKPGDKVHMFSGDLFGPGTMSYRSGYVIFRGEEQVASIVHIMS